MLEEKQFDTGTVTLNYAEGPPSGPPLVLLHGGSARWQMFEPIIPNLVPNWHVYAPDFRGHGKSGRVPKRYRLQDYTDDIARFLEACVKQPAMLQGGSMGGMVSLMVAAQHPDRVRAVVVGDSPLSKEKHNPATIARVTAWRDLAGGRYTIAEIVERLKDAPTEAPGQDAPITYREKYGEDSPMYEWIATILYYNDPDMLTAVIDDYDRTMTGYEMDTLLPNIQCPVLLLQADPACGGLMTDADIERALTLLKQPTHVFFTGTGHYLLDSKELVLAAIRDFVASL